MQVRGCMHVRGSCTGEVHAGEGCMQGRGSCTGEVHAGEGVHAARCEEGTWVHGTGECGDKGECGRGTTQDK